mgnify:CR=1 FL=1
MTDDQDSNEGTQLLPDEPVEEKPEAIPEWLIEFASQPDQVVTEQYNEGLVSVTDPDTTNPETLVLETGEWQEVQGELESSDSKSFEQKALEFLDDGEYDAAANFIRLESHNPEHVAVAKQLLRSRLVLREKLQPLWDIYEELLEQTGG